MAMIKTNGRFCYIECDERNCSRKIENDDNERLRIVARVCGWERSGGKWTCPSCADNGRREQDRSR